jgi:hypothetical protein
MFAGQGRFNGWLRMPVIGCADDYGIDVFAGQHIVVVVKHFYIDVIGFACFFGVPSFDQFFAGCLPVAVYITHGYDAGCIVFKGLRQIVPYGDAAATYLTNVDLIAGRCFSKNSRRYDGRNSSGRYISCQGAFGSCFNKMPAVVSSFAHNRVSLLTKIITAPILAEAVIRKKRVSFSYSQNKKAIRQLADGAAL